jgi:hypothetical protein
MPGSWHLATLRHSAAGPGLSSRHRQLIAALLVMACFVVAIPGAIGAVRYGVTFWLYRGFPAPATPQNVVPATVHTIEVTSPGLARRCPRRVRAAAAVGGIYPVYVFVLLLAACHGLGFVCVQLSFQRGTALATAGVSTLLTNLLPILAGVIIFGESMPGGVPGALRGLGFAGALIGAALLGR